LRRKLLQQSKFIWLINCLILVKCPFVLEEFFNSLDQLLVDLLATVKPSKNLEKFGKFISFVDFCIQNFELVQYCNKLTHNV